MFISNTLTISLSHTQLCDPSGMYFGIRPKKAATHFFLTEWLVIQPETIYWISPLSVLTWSKFWKELLYSQTASTWGLELEKQHLLQQGAWLWTGSRPPEQGTFMFSTLSSEKGVPLGTQCLPYGVGLLTTMLRGSRRSRAAWNKTLYENIISKMSTVNDAEIAIYTTLLTILKQKLRI